MTSKTVRPIMTVEARDVLDKIHENIKSESRSDSIIKYVTLCSESMRSKSKLRKELKQWKLIAWTMAATCIALIAIMMITGV
jgi:hypothetical protein